MGKYKKDIRGGLTDAQSSIRSQRFAGKRKAEFFHALPDEMRDIMEMIDACT